MEDHSKCELKHHQGFFNFFNCNLFAVNNAISKHIPYLVAIIDCALIGSATASFMALVEDGELDQPNSRYLGRPVLSNMFNKHIAAFKGTEGPLKGTEGLLEILGNKNCWNNFWSENAPEVNSGSF